MTLMSVSFDVQDLPKFFIELESLILAQNERWRRVLRHASRTSVSPVGSKSTDLWYASGARVSNTWESAHLWGITFGNER